eukprot:4719137-Pleurochrysis_carterae.AAC.3
MMFDPSLLLGRVRVFENADNHDLWVIVPGSWAPKRSTAIRTVRLSGLALHNTRLPGCVSAGGRSKNCQPDKARKHSTLQQLLSATSRLV